MQRSIAYFPLLVEQNGGTDIAYYTRVEGAKNEQVHWHSEAAQQTAREWQRNVPFKEPDLSTQPAGRRGLFINHGILSSRMEFPGRKHAGKVKSCQGRPSDIIKICLKISAMLKQKL